MAVKACHISTGNIETIKFPGIEMRLMLSDAMSGGALFMAEETTGPDGGPPLHIHHRQTEIFQVLEGRYRFAIEDARYEAEVGDLLVVPAGAVHGFMNIAGRASRLQFMLTPALAAEESFRLLDQLLARAEGPPDMDELNRLMMPYGVEFVGPPLALMDD